MFVLFIPVVVIAACRRGDGWCDLKWPSRYANTYRCPLMVAHSSVYPHFKRSTLVYKLSPVVWRTPLSDTLLSYHPNHTTLTRHTHNTYRMSPRDHMLGRRGGRQQKPNELCVYIVYTFISMFGRNKFRNGLSDHEHICLNSSPRYLIWFGSAYMSAKAFIDSLFKVEINPHFAVPYSRMDINVNSCLINF